MCLCVSVCLSQECLVDEEGRFTERAGPELQNLAVMTEGTDKGRTPEHPGWTPSVSALDCMCGVSPCSDLHAGGRWRTAEGGELYPQLPV